MIRIISSRVRYALLGLMLICPAASPALGQEFPNRAIDIVVTSQAGAPSDVVLRFLVSELEPKIGQPVIPVNAPGAAGAIGAQRVVNAAADGYTLGQFNSGVLTILPHLKDSNFDPESVVPVALIATADPVLVAHPGLGVKSLSEMIERAKQSPNTLTYASVGLGSPQHLMQAGLNKVAEIELRHVPYTGAGQALQAVVAGEVDFYWTGTAGAKAFVNDGKLVAITSATQDRLSAFPDLPTIREVTNVDFAITNWLGIFAPKDVPEAIRDLWSETINEILATPKASEQLSAIGFEVSIETPQEIQSRIQRESELLKELLISVGLAE